MSAPALPADDGHSPGRLVWRTFHRNRPAVLGFWVVLAFFLIALIGIALTKGAHPVLDPREVRLPDRLQAPLARPNHAAVPAASLPRLGIYLLGTDELGRDVFARMLEGAFVSLSVGFVAVGLAVSIGIVLGGMAGYYGPRRLGIGPVRLLRVDTLITALIDLMLSFPTFFLLLAVLAFLQPSIWTIMAVIGLTGWMGGRAWCAPSSWPSGSASSSRGRSRPARQRRRMIWRHILPNAIGAGPGRDDARHPRAPS